MKNQQKAWVVEFKDDDGSWSFGEAFPVRARARDAAIDLRRWGEKARVVLYEPSPRPYTHTFVSNPGPEELRGPELTTVVFKKRYSR